MIISYHFAFASFAMPKLWLLDSDVRSRVWITRKDIDTKDDNKSEINVPSMLQTQIKQALFPADLLIPIP